MTGSCPWTRFETLWTNTHPPALCGKLGCEHIEIIRVFAGSRAEEQLLFSLFPPDIGEFYLTSRLSQLICMAEMMFEAVLTPAKPLQFAPPREKRPCCGGVEYKCFTCGKVFQRACKFYQHMEDVHRKIRVKCKCGKFYQSRNLARHQLSRACKGKA
jgi:NAD(P)H-flavin reductase